MSHEVWKEFDENWVSHSAAHYLMAIHELLEEQGYARVTDIARRLNITRGSCSISLKPLKKRGLVLEDDNRHLKLSDEGQRIAQVIERNDELLETFFHQVLGIEQEQAEIDACKMEHLLSIDTSIRLAQFMEIWQQHPDWEKKVRTVLKKEGTCDHNSESCTFCKTQCVKIETS